jgi:retinol dehydrogenase 12
MHIAPSSSIFHFTHQQSTLDVPVPAIPPTSDMLPGSALPIVTTNLTGRTVLITGANTGLGYAAALKFLRMNPARLVLAVRDVSKGLEAVRRLADELGTGVDDGSKPALEDVVQVWECDLASFASVKRFAERVDEELGRLDIAVLNAAIATSKWSTTVDGWEVS